MAKALVGFVGGPTASQVREVATLRRRVADLEALVLRLQAENDGLQAALVDRSEIVTANDILEPVSH